MSKKTNQDQLEEIASDARESFDLGDFLRGRSIRTKTVRVFTDEVTAEQRGGFETYQRELPNGMRVPEIRSWGLVRDLAQAQNDLDAFEGSKTSKEGKELKAKVSTLTDEIKALTATLLETSLQIELKAIPEIIEKDAYRAARQARGINGKLRDDQAVDFLDEHAAQMLVRTVVSITKHDGSKNQGISIESARALRGFLPKSEWEKVSSALDALIGEKVIADAVVADADF